MKQMMKKNSELKIENIDKLADDAYDMQYWNDEVNDALGQMYSVPVDVDEDELMGELEALEDDQGLMEGEGGVPSYLQEPELPSPATAVHADGQQEPTAEADAFGLPAVPQKI